jgi:ubiquinone biosynthesis protein Coq4
MLHVAVCAPVRLHDVYDGAAHGWLSGRGWPPATRNTKQDQPPEVFWDALWKLLEQPPETRRRTPFTIETMRLAGLLDPQLQARVAEAAKGRPGVKEAATAARRDCFDLRTLSAYPASTLGGALHREAAARGELNRLVTPEALGLASLPPPLDYLNARILESHLAWAAVGGYGATLFDEFGLAAFQAAQFGHHYSTLLLGLTMTTLAFDRPPGLELVLESIFRGWRHGRDTPLLLSAPWSDMLDLPLEAVRQRLGVKPFASPLTDAIAQARDGSERA